MSSYEGIFEYDGAGLPTRIQTDEGQLVKNTTGQWQWQYYLRDHQNNVRVVLDEAGAVVQETEYYPFGLPIAKTPTTLADSRTKNKYLFLNRELQPETGYLDLLARHYDPTIGRFMTVDPLTDQQEHLTPYQYGYNNPLRFSDPNGKMPDGCCDGLASYVQGVGAALRDNFATADGRWPIRDNPANVGSYNDGRSLGHKASLVISALGVADGLVKAGGAATAAVLSEGALALPAAAVITESLAQAAVSLNGGKNAVNNLQNDRGKLNTSSNNKSYTPKESLPRDARGNPTKDPTASGPHSQLGGMVRFGRTV